MEIMKKLITILSLALLISSASAQNTTQSNVVKDTIRVDKKDPVIIILCMPFPSCEKLSS
ncbi:hypothetical protein GAB14E_3656 [Colwellia psychrerythraea]|uniref:Lipoprotein n=1 Tax=Colwellia psychrerythraea TaxID=28229 RepID=A0A099KLB1_COLPS|nr:hypothetical protein GAB14E_3656 [Colwellia psychrerythraea]